MNIARISTPVWELAFEPVKTHPPPSSTSQKASKVQSLIKDNHEEFQVLYNHLEFHNHLPHHLGASFILGGDDKKLEEIYEETGNHELTRKKAHRSAIGRALTKENWREALNAKPLADAVTDFFDREVETHNGDWRTVLDEYLYSGDAPLFHGIMGGLAHSIIHLAYAYEFESKEVATEALALSCSEYDPAHTYFDQPTPSTSSYNSPTILSILENVHSDPRLDVTLERTGYRQMNALTQKFQQPILNHYHAWDLQDLNNQFQETQITSIRILIATRAQRRRFDFFLAHVLTASLALRVALHHVPQERRVTYLRLWWFWVLQVYISQNRPSLNNTSIEDVRLDGKDWGWVSEQATRGQWSDEVHFVKVVRSIKTIAETWPRHDEWCLKAAVNFVENFHGWTFEGY